MRPQPTSVDPSRTPSPLRRRFRQGSGLLLLGALGWIASACSDANEPGQGDTSEGTGGSTGGTLTTGGSGGTSTGGVTNTGGDTTFPGTAGAASGGSDMGTGGSSHTAVPSPGCGKGGRPANGIADGNNYTSDFPQSYDGSTPMPLLVGLHAYNNSNTQIRTLTNNSRLAENFVRVYPKSTGQGWVYNTDVGRVNSTIQDMLDKYCIDESRIFVTGHSSGAQMAVQMLCNGSDWFAGAAPVAASKYCNKVDPIPTMYIQGIEDAQRGGKNGKDVVDVFASSNSCSAMTTPVTDVASCNSSFNGKPVNHGCVAYQGCEEPLIWCSHNDEGYNAMDGHYHGWPCFASNAMADFFESLP